MEMPGYKFIEITSDTLGGKPRIKGTRISVSVILTNLAAGSSIDEILEFYPHLTREMVEDAISYAANELGEKHVAAR